MSTTIMHRHICTRIIIMKQSSSFSAAAASFSSLSSSWKTMLIIGFGMFFLNLFQPHPQVHGAYHLMKYGRRFPLSMSMSMANERRSSMLFNRTARLSNVFDRFHDDGKPSLLVPLNRTKLASTESNSNDRMVFGRPKVDENSFPKNVLEQKPPLATTKAKSKPRKVIAATITTQSTLMKSVPSASSSSLSPSIQAINGNEPVHPSLIANRGAFGFRKPRTSLNKT